MASYSPMSHDGVLLDVLPESVNPTSGFMPPIMGSPHP
jgi:hypothetical protein